MPCRRRREARPGHCPDFRSSAHQGFAGGVEGVTSKQGYPGSPPKGPISKTIGIGGMPVSEVAGLGASALSVVLFLGPKPFYGSLCRTLLDLRFKRKILLNGTGHLIYEDRLHQTNNKPLCQRLFSCSRRCAATTPFVPILLIVPSARGRESKTLQFGLVSGWSIPWFQLESGLSILRSNLRV